MRRIILLLAFVLGLQLTAGCDFLRTVAGRPTSADIAARRDAIALEEARAQAALAREQAVRDSLAAVERHRADSAAA